MSAKPHRLGRPFLATVAMPLSAVIGAGVAALTSHTFDWHALGVIMGVLVGATSGGACWGIFVGLATEVPAGPDRLSPDEIAGNLYWRAYVDAHDGLGKESPSAGHAAKNQKRTLAPQIGPWSSHLAERRTHYEDYWLGYHSRTNKPANLIGEAEADASRAQFRARTGAVDENVTDYNWRSMIMMPVFQHGQSATNYWAHFDSARQSTDQLTHGERHAAAASRQLPLAEPDRVALNTRSYEQFPPHMALIEETNLVRRKLAHASKIHIGDLGCCLSAILSSIDAIIAGLKDNPLKLIEVQRLFTYYLPEIGNLLKARDHMSTIAQHSRVSEIDVILVRIEAAVATFALRMHEADIRALDIDLKLLDQALAAEFENGIGT